MLVRCIHATLIICAAAASSQAVELNVYIITGQSNSLGTTSLETPFEPGTDPADAQASIFWSNVNATNTSYPPLLYGDSSGVITTLQTQQGDGGTNPTFWGPEFGMARTMFDAGLTNLLIIKASRGGGSNTFWDKAAFEANHDSGHMWGHLRDTIDAALAKVIEQGNTFDVKGLAYIQGESNNAAEAAIADSRLNDLINNLQSHINTTYPGAANAMHTVIGEIAASGSNSNRSQTTQLQMALAAGDSDITFVATSDLPPKSDGIHFGRNAKLTIGERYAGIFIGVSAGIGDLTGDSMINLADWVEFKSNYRLDTNDLSGIERLRVGDFDRSGVVGFEDFAAFRNLYDEANGSGALAAALSSVLEPCSLTLLLIGALVMCQRKPGNHHRKCQFSAVKSLKIEAPLRNC